MDDIDKNIISELRNDARISVRTLARKLQVSASTLNYRINRLEEENIIEGYYTKINLKPNTNLFHISLLVQVVFSENESFIEIINSIPEIYSWYHTTGKYNFILFVHSKDHETFLNKIYLRLSKYDFIKKIKSQIVISSFR